MCKQIFNGDLTFCRFSYPRGIFQVEGLDYLWVFEFWDKILFILSSENPATAGEVALVNKVFEF